MTTDDLQNLIRQGESNTLEFKRSTAQLKSAAQTLCAFLNGSGGVVLIGVNDKGQIIGQEVTDHTQRELGNMLARLAPETNVEVSYLDIGKNNKQIIALKANHNANLQPYTFDGKPYIRLESNTIAMSRDQYHRLSLNNIQRNKGWEDGIIDGAIIDDLDTEEIIYTITKGLANGRISRGKAIDDPKKALKRLKLFEDGKLTNAAVVLFAKDPVTWFPQCKIRLARFRGTNKREFIDNRQVEGNVFKIIDAAMSFAIRHLSISSRFESGKLERIDEPSFPLDALREIFANAVCHRDYSARGESISFAIYDDRLEIWNPGTLPFGVTFDNLKFLNESKPRNPRIASVLYYHKLFESWGMGIELIIDSCTKAGHPEPEFFERAGGFCVLLRSKEAIGQTAYEESTSPKTEVLSDRQQEILAIIKQQKVTNLGYIVAHLTSKPTERTIQRDLDQLKKLGYINNIGFGRSAKWILMDT